MLFFSCCLLSLLLNEQRVGVFGGKLLLAKQLLARLYWCLPALWGSQSYGSDQTTHTWDGGSLALSGLLCFLLSNKLSGYWHDGWTCHTPPALLCYPAEIRCKALDYFQTPDFSKTACLVNASLTVKLVFHIPSHSKYEQISCDTVYRDVSLTGFWWASDLLLLDRLLSLYVFL